MRTSSKVPSVTKKYHIEVPLHEYYSTPCVFKVRFGPDRYLIWKGKSLLSSCQHIADVISASLKGAENNETDYFHHVCTYVKHARILKGYVTRMHDDFNKNWLGLLKFEQELLDKAYNDPNCLNNNEKAYCPKWMGEEVEVAFDQWYEDTRKKKRKQSKKK